MKFWLNVAVLTLGFGLVTSASVVQHTDTATANILGFSGLGVFWAWAVYHARNIYIGWK